MTLLGCRINGLDTTRLDVRDRGCQYGDGLFETIAINQGQPEFLEPHLRRLAEGARRLAMPCPVAQQWLADIAPLLEGQQRAVLKLMLTRGQGGRGYILPDDPEVTRIVLLYPWPEYPADNREQGVTVRLCHTMLATQPALAGLKHLNRLEQVLARHEWDDTAIAEGLMFDSEGYLIEATMSNVFLIKDDVLHTPDLSGSGVQGIMRQQIMNLAKQHDIPLVTGRYRRKDVAAADGLFLTNSLIGIWPVRQLEDRALAIPGLVRQLQEQLDTLRLQSLCVI